MKRKKEPIELSINGESYEITVEAQETLLEVLRGPLGLAGTKEGCGSGECGTCTVLLDGVPILSCLTLALDCQNREITTIEGVGTAQGVTRVQEAFLETGAIQCGFCTPGMVLATTALLKRTPNPNKVELKEALEGHLCRCTGYNKIVEAVEKAAGKTSFGSD